MPRPAGRARNFSKLSGSSRVRSVEGVLNITGRVRRYSIILGRIGSDRVGSDRVGSDRFGSDRVGSGRVRGFQSSRIGSGVTLTRPDPARSYPTRENPCVLPAGLRPVPLVAQYLTQNRSRHVFVGAAKQAIPWRCVPRKTERSRTR